MDVTTRSWENTDRMEERMKRTILGGLVVCLVSGIVILTLCASPVATTDNLGAADDGADDFGD